MGSQKSPVLEPSRLGGDWSGLTYGREDSGDLGSASPKSAGQAQEEGTHLLAWSPWNNQARWEWQEDRFLAERKALPEAFKERLDKGLSQQGFDIR